MDLIAELAGDQCCPTRGFFLAVLYLMAGDCVRNAAGNVDIPNLHATVDPARSSRGKPSALLDTRVVYCGDNLEQLAKLPDQCIDLIYIDPPFNSNRNYEVFWGETKEKRSFEDRHAST